MILSDEEVWDCYEHSHGNTEYTKAKAFGRMLQIRIAEKLNSAEPVAWVHFNGHIQRDGVGVPTHLYTVEKGWTPLYEHQEVKND